MQSAFVRRKRSWMLSAIVALVFAQIFVGSMQRRVCGSIAAAGSRRNCDRRPDARLLMPPEIHLWFLSRRTRARLITRRARKVSTNFQAQAAKEPLALKLADDVGHVRHRRRTSPGRC